MANRKIQTYQIKAKNLYTTYFVFELDGECKFIKTKHYSDRAVHWLETAAKKSTREMKIIIVIKEICSWLPVAPFYEQNLLLFIQPRWQPRTCFACAHQLKSIPSRAAASAITMRTR